MGDNEENTNGANGEQQKKLSVEIQKLFSHGQEDKGILKVSIWNGKVGFDFSKVDATGAKRAFTTLDYEKVIFINGLITGILKDRVEAYRTGRPYSQIDITVDQSFPDKDHPGELRKNGTLVFKTVPVKNDKGEVHNRICIGFESGTDTYYVTLCSRILAKQTSERCYKNSIDPDDSRFFYFAYAFNSITQNFPVLAYLGVLADLQLSKPKSNYQPREGGGGGGYGGGQRNTNADPSGFRPRPNRQTSSDENVKEIEF